jgi:histone-lysine N-methyltransferase MLL3
MWRFAWQDVCFVCGGNGFEDYMLFCIECGEAYHAFCLDAPLATMSKEHRMTWRCTNCKVCAKCGICTPHDESKLLCCDGCENGFHLECMDPPMDTIPTQEEWYCDGCVSCKHCHTTIKSWSYARDACRSCWEYHKPARRFVYRSGNVCMECGRDDARQAGTVTCSICGGFVHLNCDPLAMPVGMVHKDRVAERWYACRGCCKRRSSQETYVGSGEPSWNLLRKMAEIQRARLRTKQAVLQQHAHEIERDLADAWARDRHLYEAVSGLVFVCCAAFCCALDGHRLLLT